MLNRATDVDDGVNTNDTETDYYRDSLQVTDPKGQTYTQRVNKLGWTTSADDPLGDAHAYQYDVGGLLRRWTNRRGSHNDYTYDALGRLLTAPGDAMSYTSVGKVVTAENSNVTETMKLNERGQPDSVITYFEVLDETCTLAFTYNSNGVLTEIVPSGTAGSFMTRDYSYDTARGTLEWIKLNGEQTEYGFAADLFMDEIGLPGSNDVDLTRTSSNEMAGTDASAGYGTTTERQSGFDAANRIDQHVVPGASEGHRYAYDGLGRLTRDTSITFTGGCGFTETSGYDCGSYSYDSHVTYEYDAANNRTDLYADYVPGSNRLLEFDGCEYEADDDGNVTEQDCSGTVTSFHWDARNRLDSLNLDGTAYAFRYDPRGGLARVDKNGTHYRYFWWNGDDLLAELDTTGAVVGEYSYRGIDDLHAYKRGSTGVKYYAHKDMLGNVIALTSGTSLARTYEYDAWGQPAGGGEWVTFSGKDRARWKGALYFDEFDLYYTRARWYQPATGRFLSEDPSGLQAGLNPYVFGGDDPINFRDPSGKWCEIVNKEVKGTHATVTVPVLVCRDIRVSDWYTIRRFLNSGVPGSGDEAFARAEAQGWTAWSRFSCTRMGFENSQCGLVADALSVLTVHNENECRKMGVGATKRFQAGRFRRSPKGSINGDNGVAGASRWAFGPLKKFGRIYLTPEVIIQNPRIRLENSVLVQYLAHEERHIAAGLWDSEEDAETLGQVCAGAPGGLVP